MKLKIINKLFFSVALGLTTLASTNIHANSDNNVYINSGDWIKQSGDFVTLDRSAKQVEFFVHYPQLRGGNCGIGLALNRRNSYTKIYQKLIKKITVSNIYPTDSETGELTPVSVSNKGATFAFNFDAQYYGTIVTISTKGSKTFGEVFDSLSAFDNVHALASAVSCKQLDTQK
ncbi:hypothetical protein H0A36_17285 [Endozoicomonas sp. SM1973]|uniref:Uncharacterized protein n=1 Tax=Spartinivicinus marinus TaxID=2994442 RepID=A0A853I500_9GAMM|nr:hypothetical protein [Spartinivicinus marinus]MCX4029150.1 hypothetical protein [Spartinivicinus marinus]NYZ67769.1 hypothetical protein [Spartinivicinus marinus]